MPFRIREDPPGRELLLLQARRASEQTFWGPGGTRDVIEDRLQNLDHLLHARISSETGSESEGEERVGSSNQS